jgi:hypothetical protein
MGAVRPVTAPADTKCGTAVCAGRERTRRGRGGALLTQSSTVLDPNNSCVQRWRVCGRGGGEGVGKG